MASITWLEMADALANTLGAAAGINSVESLDEITASFEDLPKLRVYPREGSTDTMTSNDRSTFGAVRRVSETLFHVDLIAHQRAHLEEDFAALAAAHESVQALIEAQKKKPYFGEARIMGYRWEWEITDFQQGAGESALHYLGVRYRIWLKAA